MASMEDYGNFAFSGNSHTPLHPSAAFLPLASQICHYPHAANTSTTLKVGKDTFERVKALTD